MSASNVPVDWSACYDVNRCSEVCAWMPCDAFSLYMGPVQALRHRMQCQRCTEASMCWGTATNKSMAWSHARFAVLAPGNTTVAEKCSSEMSTALMAILLALIVALATAVCYFARRQSRMRQVRGMRLEEDDDGESEENSPESA